MVSAIGGASDLSSVRSLGGVASGREAAVPTPAASPVSAPASAGATGSSASGALAPQTARAVLGAQEQRTASGASGGGQAAAPAASGTASDTLTPFEELLDTNGDGVVDWRDYVSSEEEAVAAETPSVIGYTALGGAATAPAATGTAVSLVV